MDPLICSRVLRDLAYVFATLLVSLSSASAQLKIDENVKRPSLLIDAGTGDVLFQEHAMQRWAPASLTKLMTAYVTFHAMRNQQITKNSPVRISEAALEQPPSKIGLPIGTILNIDTALKMIMVKSANDIAHALGEAVAGTEPDFVRLMNSHARRLGMVGTNFVNPHGLHDDNQYTTARDFGILALALTHEFPQHRDYFKIPAIRLGKSRMRNHNALLERFAGSNGMKTGYVCASGLNVVARAEREGRELIAVVLGGRSGLTRNIRAAKLLEEGFDGQHKKQAVVLGKLRSTDAENVLQDMTLESCPKKYRAQKRMKVWSNPYKHLEQAVAETGMKPRKRPLNLTKKVIAASVVQSDIRKGDIPEDLPPTLLELEGVYLTPRKRIGDDVRVSLGGGTGLNPFGFAHVNGATPPELLQKPENTNAKKKRKAPKKASKKVSKKEKPKKTVVTYANR